MKIEFIGAAHEVTGSCHYLEVGDKHMLVDCGMEQGADIYENQEIPIDAASIDYVFVTHAHIDHSGLLPLLYVRGFRGSIFATNASTQLCEIMLKDSAHIQEMEVEWKNRKARRSGGSEIEPMYTVGDAEAAMRLFVPCGYGEDVQVCDEIKICFHDAGHLLGSSFIEIHAREDGEEISLIFSGDLGNGNRALIRDPELPGRADYLIIESTYGDRLHEVPPDYAEELSKVLRDTFANGGNVVIPAFSVGRTQEILYYMREVKERGMLPDFRDFEVYIDSPLSVEATGVFNKNVLECFRKEDLEMIKSGVNPIQFTGLRQSVSSDDSKAINFDTKPKVIISASGMCEAGRIRHHLKHNLWRAESTVVFVGYQVPGTLGHQLLSGVKEVKLFGEKVQVNAKIINLPGISGHADRDHLVAWARGLKRDPKRVFVVHGEDSVCDGFAEYLSEQTGMDAVAPYSGDVYDLRQNLCIAEGSRRKVKKSKERETSAVFERLLAAGRRLIEVIQKNKEGANKDLAKFADQINSLCDKWDRQ